MRWIVVGAGSAGCVVAARLAEADEDVVVVEAGAGATNTVSRSPSFFDATAAPGLTFAEPFTRGRGVGGSSAVNGMIATPGDDAQYRAWGWSDTDDAFARVRVPVEQPAASELGPIDRALLATSRQARSARRSCCRRPASVDRTSGGTSATTPPSPSTCGYDRTCRGTRTGWWLRRSCGAMMCSCSRSTTSVPKSRMVQVSSSS